MSAAVALRSHDSQLPMPRVARATLPLACLVTVVARIPWVGRPLGPDEAGFLVVAQQWHAGGSSLYGNYWVDRPPFLLTIFALAAQLGGATALRLIGIVAAVLVVVLAAELARRLAGPRAAAVSAVAAAALLANPQLGVVSVNGELLAAPFVLGGLVVVVAALRAVDTRAAVIRAMGAGVLAVAALMIKQNMADVVVFGVVASILTCWRGDITLRRLAHLMVAGLASAVLALAVFAGWTLAHGTSLSGVYEAMYPFRFRASEVMARYGNAGNAAIREHQLWLAALTSGLLVVLVASCWAALTRRISGPFIWALMALLAFDVVSIAMGGNFWAHYLVQPLGVAAVLAGVLASRWWPNGAVLAATVAVLAVAAWVPFVVSTPTEHGTDVGSAIRTVAGPGDTIVSAWGNAEIVHSSGLSSPYRYLWSLPVKTLDPQLVQLNQTLAGPRAPTWFVSGHTVRSWGLDTGRTQQLLQSRYHVVARQCGLTIRLLNGLGRPAPVVTACNGAAAAGGAS